MNLPTLLVHVQDHVMTLTLNRPDKLNAIDPDMASELLSALQRAQSDPDVRAVLMLGTGRAFCAGRDVSAPPTKQDLVGVQAVSSAVVSLAKPVVVGVHGWTIGGGLEWMLNADLVVAGTNSRFKFPEASLGVFVTGGVTATLPACAGLARAKAMLLLGEAFDAEAAHAWGLVWRVVEASQVPVVARDLALQLAGLQPQVVAQFKRVLNQVGLGQFEHAVALETAVQRSLQGAEVSASGAPHFG